MHDTFGYDIDDVKEIIVHLSDIHIEAEEMQQRAIQEKYKAIKYLHVSTVTPKKITADDLNEIVSNLDDVDDLNTTAENIENVRQKTEMLLS